MTVKEFITDPIIFGEELFAKAKEMQTKTVRACDVLAKIDEELSTMPEPFKMDFMCLVTKAVDKCENMNKDDKYDELPSVAPVEIEPKLLINTDEVVKKLCNIIIQRESKECYSIKITANERCKNCYCRYMGRKE